MESCGACHEDVIAGGWCEKCTQPSEDDRKYFKYTFNPPQTEVYNLLNKNPKANFIVATGTGTGKTTVAEMAILKHIKNKSPGKIMVLVPLKALAHEKSNEWREKFKEVTICELTSDNDSIGYGATRNAELMANNIIVCSYEMLDSMSRKPSVYPILNYVDLIIIDEIHELGDKSRGGNLDGSITRFLRFKKYNKQDIQVVALSATFDNLDNLELYFNQFISEPINVITSKFCPIKVNIDDEIHVYNTFSRGDRTSLIADLAYSKYQETGGQVLVIVLSIPVISGTAKLINQMASKQIAGTHYSEMTMDNRRLTEIAYNKGDLKILCATPTLLAGVNMACQTIIVDLSYFNQDILKSDVLSISKIKQAAGRAGRLPYYKEANVIYVCGNDTECRAYDVLEEKNIIRGTLLHSIVSVINTEVALSEGITLEDIKEWYRMSFSFHSRNMEFYDSHFNIIIDGAILSLSEKGFIETKETDEETCLYPTKKGKIVSMLQMNPMWVDHAVKKLIDSDINVDGKVYGYDMIPLLEEIFDTPESDIVLNNRKINQIEPYFRLNWLMDGTKINWFARAESSLNYPWLRDIGNNLTRLLSYMEQVYEGDSDTMKLIKLLTSMFNRGPIPVDMAKIATVIDSYDIEGIGVKRLALLYFNGVTLDKIKDKDLPAQLTLPTLLEIPYTEHGFTVKSMVGNKEVEPILPKRLYEQIKKFVCK